MGTDHILEKVTLNFPKILYILLHMYVTRFYILCSYMLYTVVYRGFCVMFIHINYGTRVTCDAMNHNGRDRSVKICDARPMFKIFKIFVKF